MPNKQRKSNKGTDNPNYKTGKYILNKCINCQNKIDPQAIRCRSCENKRRYNNPLNHPMFNKIHTRITKRKMSLTREGTGIPYENNLYPEKFFRIRKNILKRDKYKCQKCNKKSNTVHHIDYNKANSKENNLISLCNTCHLRTNINRDYWYAYFSYIMENNIQ